MIWGTISPYCTSYIHHHHSFVTSSTLFPVLPVCFLFEGISLGNLQLVFAVWLIETIGRRLTLLFSLTFFVLGYFLSSFITNPYLLIAVFGVGIGVSCGLGSIVSIWASWRYYPDNKGQVTGLAATGFQLGPTIFGLIFTFIANPYNETPDIEVDNGSSKDYLFGEEVYERVPTTMRWISFIGLLIGVIGILCIIERPTSQKNVLKHKNAYELTEREGVTHRDFWLLLVSFFFSFFLWGYMADSYKTFGQTKIKNDHLLSYMGTAGCALGIVSNPFWGYLNDKWPFRAVMALNVGLQILISAVIYWVVEYTELYFICVLTTAFCGAGLYPSFATQTGKKFGEIGNKLWSYVMWGMGTSTLVCIFIESVVLRYLGFKAVFYIIMGLLCIGFVLIMFLNDTKIIKINTENLALNGPDAEEVEWEKDDVEVRKKAPNLDGSIVNISH
jgi:MFS family permease